MLSSFWVSKNSSRKTSHLIVVCGAMLIGCHGEICSEEATGKTGGKMESSYCMLNDAFMMYSAQPNAKSPGVHPLVTNYASNGALNAVKSGKFC